MRVLSELLSFLLLTHIARCQVNIATNNEAWYCNNNPLESHSISPLSDDDLSRISKLKQVHVMTRHGARTHQKDIQHIFPNNSQYYQCNISTITSRLHYLNNDNAQYFVPMETIYEQNNQFLAHSNCQRMQSHPILIQQHEQNAQILMNAYMSSNDASQLFDIRSLSASDAKQHLKTYTSNRERCMMSTMVLISTLLNVSASNTSSIVPVIETITNDLEFNPYASPVNSVCIDNEQWQKWNSAYNDDIMEHYEKPKHNEIVSQSEYKDIMLEYKEAGGIIDGSQPPDFRHVGFHMTFYYCNGFDIPLINSTFWKFVDSAYKYMALLHPDAASEDATERKYGTKKQCYNHFMGIPMYTRFVNDIQALMEEDADYNPFILHSAHDSSIAQFLTGLGLHDGVTPYFAQMFSLEIYTANADNDYYRERTISYLFRFTNKGEFVAYAPCAEEYKAQNGTELCDLNILLKNGFKNVNMTQRYWADTACKTVLDDCVCGYCATADDDKWKWWQWKSFVLGISCSLLLFALLLCIIQICRNRKSSNERGYQQALDDDAASDIEMEQRPVTHI